MATTNQGFIPAFNTLYSNLINKIVETRINLNSFNSPFSKMVSSMEVGAYIENIHVNPGRVMLFDSVINSDVLTNYIDDIATSYSPINVDLAFPSTYFQYNVRQAATMLENVSLIIDGVISNIQTTFEYTRNNLCKQMLYNAYMYGMIDSIVLNTDPRTSKEASGDLAVALNTTIDDFMTEPSTRDIPYNNQVGLQNSDKRVVISNSFPYVILFNEYVRYTEFSNAINLNLVGRFKDGKGNMDWQSRYIYLNLKDFPNSIPPTPRNQVTASNSSIDGINFFPMPINDVTKAPLYPNKPTGGDTIIGFVLDSEAMLLKSQLHVNTFFQNPATLSETNRMIYRGIIDLNIFKKIRAITMNSKVTKK